MTLSDKKYSSTPNKVNTNIARISSGCAYFHDQQTNADILDSQPNDYLADIEELKIDGKNNKFCPYYQQRQKAKNSDVILVTYNYLLMPEVLKYTFKAMTQETFPVIIFDEAHNIESASKEILEISLKSKWINQMIHDCKQFLQKEDQYPFKNKENAQFI